MHKVLLVRVQRNKEEIPTAFLADNSAGRAIADAKNVARIATVGLREIMELSCMSV